MVKQSWISQKLSASTSEKLRLFLKVPKDGFTSMALVLYQEKRYKYSVCHAMQTFNEED